MNIVVMASPPRLDNGSRMSREVHVRFCEGLGVRLPRAHLRLRGALKWQFFYLSVLLDIYSRYVVGWLVAPAEDVSKSLTHSVRTGII